MESIRNVQLIPTHDPAYQNFLRNLISVKRQKVQQTTKAAVLSPTPTTAPKPNPQWLTQRMSRRAEWLVRQWLGYSAGMHDHRILSYEEHDSVKKEYIRRYREVDAIRQEAALNHWVLAEVKLSRNPQSVAAAVQQVSRSSEVLEAVGWHITPLVVWLNYGPCDAIQPYPLKPFHPDFHLVPRSYFNRVSIISVCPKSLFQWGVYKGWVSSVELENIAANCP